MIYFLFYKNSAGDHWWHIAPSVDAAPRLFLFTFFFDNIGHGSSQIFCFISRTDRERDGEREGERRVRVRDE